MVNQPGRGRDAGEDDLSAEPPPLSDPPFSDEGMRRIVYGEDREMLVDALNKGRARDSRSTAFADDTAELEANLRGRRSLVPIVTALAAVVCFGAIVWYAYTWGTGQMDSDDLPVVHAQPMPEKVKPEQPGGMDVPHQGIAVLNNGTDGEAPQTVERLLPRPEIPQPPQPLPPPEPPQSAQAEPEAPLQIPAPPAMADGSDADVTGAPAEEPAEMAQDSSGDGIAKPIPKPQSDAGGQDQIANLLEEEPLETANGNNAVAPAATQMAAVTTGDVVLQLSSVSSEAAAAKEWKRLQGAYPGLLGKLGLTLETADVKGTTYYRVQTGPFASREAAADLCAQLKARNQDCLVKQR